MRYVVESVDRAIAELRRGRHVVLMNDVAPPGRGRVDLVLPAELAQPLSMAMLVRFTSGFVNVALPRERCAALRLPALGFSEDADERPLAAVAVDAANGVTTGISATDRATTARLLADPDSVESDFTRPGHVVPLRVPTGALRAHSGVALEVDLCRLAGLAPAAVRSELVHSRGELVGLHEAERVARAKHLVLLSARSAFRELGIEQAGERPGDPTAGASVRVVGG